MTTPWCSRHTSYATWRLQVLTRLCLSELPHSSRATGSLQKRGRTQHSRSFHYSSQHLKDGRGADGGKNTRRTHVRIAEAKARRANPPRPEWNPFIAKGREDLEALLADLDAIAEQPQANTPDKAPQSGSQFIGDVGIAYSKFTSPIEQRVATSVENSHAKQHPDSRHYDPRLAMNPWAQILSEPLRQCIATQARLPKGLLTTWAPIRSPADGKDYLLPIEAADLKALNDRPNPQPLTHVYASGVRTKYSDALKGQRVHIQPNGFLLRSMTDRMTIRGPNRTKGINSAMLSSFLIPYRWVKAIAMTTAYRKTRAAPQIVDEPNNSGRKTHVLNTPEANALDLWKQDVPDLSNLQWDLDIAQRFQKVASERVLVTLEGLASENASNGSLHDLTIHAVKLPSNGRFTVTGPRVVAEEDFMSSTLLDENKDNSQNPAIHWLPGSFFLHMGNADDYANIVEQWQRQEGRQRQGTNRQAKSKQNLKTKENSQTSAVHRPVSTTSTQMSDLDQMNLRLPSLQYNAYHPPTVTLSAAADASQSFAARLPVFNLKSLLGPSYDERVDDIINHHKCLGLNLEAYPAAREHADVAKPRTHTKTTMSNESERDTTPVQDLKQEYLILVKASAMRAADLAGELWQLWRYIGGRDGLFIPRDGGEVLSDLKTTTAAATAATAA